MPTSRRALAATALFMLFSATVHAGDYLPIGLASGSPQITTWFLDRTNNEVLNCSFGTSGLCGRIKIDPADKPRELVVNGVTQWGNKTVAVLIDLANDEVIYCYDTPLNSCSRQKIPQKH